MPSSSLPSSLELELRLRDLGADPALLTLLFTRLEKFRERFRDERYLLMTERQINKKDYAETLARAIGTDVTEVVFMSLEDLSRAPRERQLELYRLTKTASIRSYLERRSGGKLFASTREGSRPDGRKMIDVIKGAIGTRRLTTALDNTFGNSFGSLFRHDLVAMWVAHLHAHVPSRGGVANPEQITWTGKLVDYLTKTLPIFRLPKPPHSWTSLVHECLPCN